MNHPAAHDRFLRRARRRWVAWRIVEGAGIGAALAAGFALVFVLVLAWRGESAVRVAAGLIGVGAVAGAIFGAAHTPTILQTAIQADRQLELHDLLSTAVLAAQARDRAFAAIVISQAEAICRTRSPNELIVQKLGGRAWGGIGIVTALVLTLSMMSTQPHVTQASQSGSASTDTQRRVVAQQAQANAAVSRAAPETVSRPEHPREGDGFDGSADAHEGAGRSNFAANPSGEGTGASAGRTPDARVATLRPGTSAANDAVTTNTTSSGSTATQSSHTTRHAPPWQSAQWPSFREAAMKDVQSGRTPDAYRDLVREYFNDRHDD